MILRLPKGYTLQGPRAPQKVEGPFGYYEQSVTAEGRGGCASGAIWRCPSPVSASAAYPAFCRFISAIEHAERQGFLFGVAAPKENEKKAP